MIIYRLTHRPEICIVGVSLAVNLLVLPIYNRADAVQEEERRKQKEMSHWVEHIKKSFKGDERMMMLQTYYRQQHYKPIYAVKSTVSVLLQIPFFIAAYHFLSNLDILFRASCGPISDLSSPDGLILLWGIRINLLPILMTLINIISGLIYSKGLAFKESVQIPILAVLFLILLYNSPSGLVLYWTFNNVFSLFKNIFKKYIKNPGLVFSVIVSVSGAVIALCMLKRYWNVATKFRILGFGLIVLTSIPLLISLITKIGMFEKKYKNYNFDYDNKFNFIAGIMMVALMGLLIPSTVIKPSPTEFYDYAYFIHPLHYVGGVAMLFFGFFIVWELVFYYLADKKTRSVIAKIMLVMGFCSLVNFMLFGNHLGNISADMVFDEMPSYSSFDSLKNILVLAMVVGIVLALNRKKKLLWNLSVITTISIFALSGMNLIDISKQVSEDRRIHDAAVFMEHNSQTDSTMLFSLSENANNTIVIMLDRAISAYVPFILEERPELREQFEDFIYYPNTVSYGGGTVISTPSLFGGYEYTPKMMISDNGQTFREKQNEALKVLPVLFDENGYDVVVCDPPFAGLRWIPDLSIYENYPEINARITKGSYSQMYTSEDPKANVRRRERSVFCYSVFKCIPVGVQTVFYDGGFYWSSDSGNAAFINQYSTLCCLPEITGVTDKPNGTFFMIDNDTTHEPCELQLPDYVPGNHIDNTGLESGIRTLPDGSTLMIDARYHYHVNMAAFLKIGEWLEYLKSSGVYDNTRIIIVSDHGASLAQFDSLIFEVDGDVFDGERYNPLFLYKDINNSGFHEDLKISDEFRTLADVPALAATGMVENPINPFTGYRLRELNDSEDVLICVSGGWGSDDGDLTAPKMETVFYTVHDSIFAPDNWKRENGN